VNVTANLNEGDRPIHKLKTKVRPLGSKGAEASPLVNKRSGNSDSNTDIEGWDYAQKLNLKVNIWRKGHLVHHDLGGDGKKKWNLRIITQKANTDMINDMEGPAIKYLEKLVKSKNAEDQNKVMYYRTTVEDASKPNFVTQVTVEWGTQTFENGKYGKENKILRKETTKANVPEKADDIKVNLDNPSFGRIIIESQFGLKNVVGGEQIARDIVKARKLAPQGKFGSMLGLSEALSEYHNSSDKAKKQMKILNTKMDRHLNSIVS